MSKSKNQRPTKSDSTRFLTRLIIPREARARAPIFWVHIDHIDNWDGRVWAVRQGRRYYTTHKVWINVPLAETVYRKRPQPRAYIRGEGYVQVNDDGSISIN